MWKKIYAIFLCFCPIFIVLFDTLIMSLYNAHTLSDNPFLLGPLSMIIIYTIFLALLFITKSYRKSNIILLISSFILITINQIKIYYMQEPIYLSDIKLLGGFGDVMKFTSDTLGSFFTNYYLFLTIHILFISITTFILIKFKYESETIKRKIYYILPIIILIIISLPFNSTNNFIKEYFLKIDNLDDSHSITYATDYIKLYGFSGGIYANMINSRIFQPSNYSATETSKILEYNSDRKIETNNDYDIIFILSEAFFDITKVDDIKFSDDILKDYHDLSKKGKLIQMISSTFGGRTSNVEFELFTSFNLAYYDSSYIPYLNMFNKPFPNQGNIINVINNNSYTSHIYQAASENLYNVKNVYKYLDFNNRQIYNENKNEIKGFYISDDAIVNRTIDMLKTTNDKTFAFYKTMQNHMPYTINKYNEYDVTILNENDFEKEDKNVILSYANGIHDSSTSLKKLYDYIKSIDRKTIIIFIGDHLPYLNNSKGENIINKLKYFNTKDILLNTYRKYNTEALILSNFDINYDNTEYLSPDLLIPYIFKTTNTKMNSYFDYLIDVSKEILPSYNRYVAVDNNGKLYAINEIKDDMLDQYNIRNYLQYKIAFDK